MGISNLQDWRPPIIESEIKNAIEGLKNNKTPGPDIENETIKTFVEVLTKPVIKIFNKIVETEQIPKQWKQTEIIILYKKGSETDR